MIGRKKGQLMSGISEIKQLTHKDFVMATAVFLSIVAPGILILQLFKPNLLAALETTKAIFLAISITLPILAINFFGIGYAGHIKRVRQSEPLKDGYMVDSVFAMLATISILYPATLIAYVCAFPFKSFLITVGIVQALALLMEVIAIRKAKAIPIRQLPIIEQGK